MKTNQKDIMEAINKPLKRPKSRTLVYKDKKITIRNIPLTKAERDARYLAKKKKLESRPKTKKKKKK